ncbi:MAG TPA: polysaccharide biosynthesis tyrosine autokinase [Pyrinomonadaceae bacterium]|nr:polysaccharide biosynthesis tyrosine autokinase [Pyrinomonadaceae bacterium]
MEQDQRLTPLPKSLDLRAPKSDYPAGYVGFYDDEVNEGRRSLQQYFGVVKKRLPIILALTTIATAAVAFYMYKQPSQYQATTEMVIEPRRPKVQSKDAININFGNDANYYNTQLELLQNADLMKKVVIKLGLYKQTDLLGTEERGLLSGLRSVFSSKTETAADNSLQVVSDVPANGDPQTLQLSKEERDRVDAYAGFLAGKLAVNQKERTNLVTVSVTTPKPELSAAVADKVAEVFIEEDVQRETQGARQSYNDLSKSIDDLGRTIAEQEAALINYMRDSGLPLAQGGEELASSRLQGLSETWMKSLENRRQLEARYNAAVQAGSRGQGSNIPDLYDNKIYQDTIRLNTERRAKLQDDIRGLDKEIEDLEAKRQAANTKWTPEHPEMKILIATIDEKKASRSRKEKETSDLIDRDQKKIERDAVSGALTSLRSQVDAARHGEQQSQAAYEKEAASANLQGQSALELKRLKDALDTNRNLLNTYTQRQKEQELAIAGSRPENIKIAANAVAPGGPIGPQRTRNILVAFLVSFAVGIGLAFLLDYLDDSVKTSDDIGRHLGLPTLAMIPHHFGSEKRRLKLAAANGNGNANGNGSLVPTSTGLITLEERRSPMAEAYRHLRTSLLFSSAGKPPQSILVTSSQPSEGKTTTAINTAVTLAQADADVVIVDCDLRRPRLHSYFELENTQGLTNYLSGERNTEFLIKQCKDLPRLKVITSGPIPPNPAELLSSNEMKNLLQFLRGRYKHVIIDSPPAISFTDAAILATLVDGVVLVAMAGKSSLHLMRRFKHRLGNIGARIYGVVLNGIKSGSMEYDYYGSGYYEYYAKSEEDTSTPMMEDVATHRTER